MTRMTSPATCAGSGGSPPSAPGGGTGDQNRPVPLSSIRPSQHMRSTNDEAPAVQTDDRGLVRREELRSVRVLAAVVLEDPPAQGDRTQGEADDEQPPAKHDAQDDRGEAQRAVERPPAVGRVEAQLTGAVGDLGLLAVLGPRLVHP